MDHMISFVLILNRIHNLEDFNFISADRRKDQFSRIRLYLSKPSLWTRLTKSNLGSSIQNELRISNELEYLFNDSIKMSPMSFWNVFEADGNLFWNCPTWNHFENLDGLHQNDVLGSNVFELCLQNQRIHDHSWRLSGIIHC